MEKRIIINAAEFETRIALVEDTKLAELHVQSRGDSSIAGNIYRGRVLRVLPGMQAAFVDLGLEKAGFMHVSDFWTSPGEMTSGEPPVPDSGEDLEQELGIEPSLAAYADEIEEGPGPIISRTELEIEGTAEPADVAGPNDRHDMEPDAPHSTEPSATEDGGTQDNASPPEADEATATASRPGGRRRGRRSRAKASPSAEADEATAAPDAADTPVGEDANGDESQPPRPPLPAIEELLAKNQEILVQVSKEPIGTKGARITSHISLPGRYVVYMPTTDHIGVSRRIEDEKERARLRDIVSAGRGKTTGGFIVRTVCEGVSKREILADMRFLSKLWTGIVKKNNVAAAPALLHEDLDMVLRAVRDLFSTDVTQVVVDRQADRDRIVDFVDSVLQPRLKSRVEHYTEAEPIFDHFAIENQVHRALARRVWLKSGGYLVFDQTEALTTIDVNTGRFVGKKTHEETVLKTNLEAARVALDQLRLRNIGGIIIIDFIDMEKAANRKKVSEVLAEAVKLDKARTNILRISELGLVQMTRKRTRDNLRHLLTAPCPTCHGDGRLRAVEALAADALRAVRRALATSPEAKSLRLRLPGEVARALLGPLAPGRQEFQDRLGVRLEIEADERLGRGHSEIHILESAPGTRPAAPKQGDAASAATDDRAGDTVIGSESES